MLVSYKLRTDDEFNTNLDFRIMRDRKFTVFTIRQKDFPMSKLISFQWMRIPIPIIYQFSPFNKRSRKNAPTLRKKAKGCNVLNSPVKKAC